MDRRENQFQSPTICRKLFNAIMSCLASQIHKTITLGDPRLSTRSAEKPNSVESQGCSSGGAERNSDPSARNLSCQGLSFEKVNFSGKLAPNDDEEPPPGNGISDDVDNKERVHSRCAGPGEKEQQNSNPEYLSQEKGVRRAVSFDHKVEIIEWRKRKLKKLRSTERTSLLERDDDEIITPLKPILKTCSGLDATWDPSTQQPDEANNTS
ncbi:uncharacterized protein J3R85_003472 [Psidium guajava]|nr:uncharacterized protein J3R85_003472 [Psidium guajava]